jgi:hypothetical protein
MVRSIEEVVGKLETERAIPGTRPGENEKVRYVSFAPGDVPGLVYQRVIREIVPPLMTNGGVMLEGCIITTPNGANFYPLVLNGDIEGWQRQIEQGANKMGLSTAKIVKDIFVISDGRSYPLSECTAEFD